MSSFARCWIIFNFAFKRGAAKRPRHHESVLWLAILLHVEAKQKESQTYEIQNFVKYKASANNPFCLWLNIIC